MSDLGTAKGRIVIDTKDMERAVKEVRRGSELMTKALQGIGIGVGFEAIKRLGNMAYELANNAAQAQVTRQAFDSLAASFGQNADDMLASMRTASKGMISDADLVLDANRAMLLGVADNTEKLTGLLEVARARGQAMGLTLSQAFSDLVTGLGRMSPLILDNLGIKGGQKALDDYAKSVGRTADQLSDAQKQAILFNFVMASTKGLIDASAKAGDNAAEKFAQMSTKVENTKQKLGDFLLTAGATDALDTFGTAIDDSIEQLQRLDAWLQTIKADFDALGQATGLGDVLDRLSAWNQRWDNMMGHLGFQIGTRSTDPYADPSLGSRTGIGASVRQPPTSSGSSGPIAVPPSVYDPKPALDAQIQFGKDLAKINRDSNRQILDAERDYGRQRAETIRSYELGIVREEEDFQRQRARQQRDYETSIVRIMQDAQKRDARIRSDLDEQIAGLRQDSNKRLAEQEKDFQKQRERAARDHGDRLLDAAGRLDAKAVYEEQRRYTEQQRDAAEDHKEQIDKEAENLAERIAQSQKAAERQLQDARDADAQRLEDMRAALEQQRADEDEDRKTRRERDEEDFQHQLDQQAIEQGERIQQIMDNAAEERATLQEAFNEELLALGLHNLAVEKERKRAQDAALKEVAPWVRDWFNTTIEAIQASLVGQPVQGPRPAWPSLKSLSGANSVTRTSSLTINPTIVVDNAGSRSDAQIERIVIGAMTKVLEEATP